MGKIDVHTPTWGAVEAWLEERRADCIASLINGSPADDKFRGEIRVIEDLLIHARNEEPPPITPDTDY